MDPKREAYPFAGALCVTAGNLLAAVHSLVGAPPGDDAEDLSSEDRRLAAAAAAVYGAAAACVGLSARLLLIEREGVRARVPEVGVPQRFELGVTSIEATEPRAWRATVRAAAAARAELAVCTELWTDSVGGQAVRTCLSQLVGYVDELAGVLERIEPSDVADRREA